MCFPPRQSHVDTRLFGRLVHVLDHIVVVRINILSTIMADEELDSFARLNVASEQVNFYFLLRPVPLQSIQVFSLENLPIQISTEVSQSKSYSRKSSHLKVFSLARSAEFGRFVVANKDLGVGDTVMEVAGHTKEME